MDAVARRKEVEADRRAEGTTESKHRRLAQMDALVTGPASTRARRDSLRRRLLAAVDLAALAIAYGGVWLLAPPDADLSGRIILVAVLPLWVIFNKLLGLYDRDAHLVHKSTLDELPKLALSASLGTTVVFFFAPPVLGLELGRPQSMLFAALALLAFCTTRASVRTVLTRKLSPERCLIVGSGFVADTVARKLLAHPEYGVELVGFVDVADELEVDVENSSRFTTRLGELDQFEELCEAFGVDRVVIAFSSISHERLIDAIRGSKKLGLEISVVPRLFEVIGHQVEVDQVEGMTLLGLRGFGRTRSSLALKRLIDVAISGFGLVVLSPLMLLIASMVRLTSRGPALFVQSRVGRGNKEFSMYKFRTMVDGAHYMKPALAHLNEADGPMFKMEDDPRITNVGRFLRRTSLDELPQLFNVLRGDMSLVGPRPLVPSEDVHVLGHHRERLDLTPGLTGPWQVLGRTAIPFKEMTKLDYLYVAEWSLWNDIKLLLRTAPVVFQRRGL
jgi:exopolysaccharide biosynthesis polyprenyl glycosylphosphotransferase